MPAGQRRQQRSVALTTDQIKKVERHADVEGISVSAFIAKLIDNLP